jgi:hypothetical protein
VAQRFRAAGFDQFSPRSFPHSPHEFAGAVGVFPEDVVDVFEGLFEHGVLGGWKFSGEQEAFFGAPRWQCLFLLGQSSA